MAKRFDEFIIQGRDHFGKPIVETIRVERASRLRRMFRAIARWFGYGRFRQINSISVE